MEKCENHELEKKECKRFRPTLTAYRALEKELAEVSEAYRLQLVADKHLAEDVKWLKMKLLASAEENPAYQKLKRQLDEQIEGTHNLAEDCNGWRKKYHELQAKLDNTLEQLREERKISRDVMDECQKLKNRGFWARVFNK